MQDSPPDRNPDRIRKKPRDQNRRGKGAHVQVARQSGWLRGKSDKDDEAWAEGPQSGESEEQVDEVTSTNRRHRRTGGHRRYGRLVTLSVQRPLLILGSGSVVVFGIVLAIWIRSAKSDLPASTLDQQAKTAPAYAGPSITSRDAVDLVGKAIGINSIEQVETYFQRRAEVSAAQILECIQRLNPKDGGPADIQWVGVTPRGDQELPVVVITRQLRTGLDKRLAILVPEREDYWKIDFDAYARRATPGWAEILSAEEVAAVVRVTYTNGHYYNGLFSDAKWICYQLDSLDTDQALYGYCRKDSAQNKALGYIGRWHDGMTLRTQGGGRMPLGSRATLRLRKTPDMLADQYEIEQVLAPDWLLGEQPFDKGFAAE